MRMNKFVPFLIAVAIHALAFSWFYRRNQSAHTERNARSDSAHQGIDLSGFSTYRKTLAQHPHSPSGPVKNTSATSLEVGSETAVPFSDSATNSEKGTGFPPLNDSIVLEAIDPIYPSLARQKGIEGEVKLRAFYNHNGIITKVDVIDSSGAKILDEAAKKALLSWKLKSEAEGSFDKTFQFKLNN